MVTFEEMKLVIDKYISEKERKASYAVTPKEMRRFEVNKTLPRLIARRKMNNDIENGVGVTKGYDLIEDMCLISITSLKKTINGKDRPTRTFLYRFTVGLNMTVKEANTYFSLCGGILREENPEDYLCIKALEDGDDIYSFCEDFYKYFNKKLSR